MTKRKKRSRLIDAVARGVRFAALLVLIATAIMMVVHSSRVSGDADPSALSDIIEHRPIVIVSGSMLPTIQINAVAILESCEFDDLDVGDILMYKEPVSNLNITHRVIEINTDVNGEKYITAMGDNNEHPDNVKITDQMVVGKLTKIYNKTAPFISLFVKDAKINNVALFALMVVIAVMITFLVSIFEWVCGWITSFIIAIICCHETDDVYETFDEAANFNYKALDGVDAVIHCREAKGFKARLGQIYLINSMINFREASKEMTHAINVATKMHKICITDGDEDEQEGSTKE